MKKEKKVLNSEQNVVDAMVLEIVGSFDFASVHRVMEFLNWRWYCAGGTPSVVELIKMAEELLHKAHDAWAKDGKFTECGSGGLYARCDKKGNLTLRFVMREAMVLRKAYEEKEEGV